jgi:Pyruvate/2-oxoacid:ferredoxin oxidoreductase gamma subunit
MEREILLTGIGGQSVQLAASVLARAAVRENRQVMLLGTYGGTMRGGSTEATLVVGDEPLVSPPIVSHGWSAVAMHHRFWSGAAPKVRDGGVVVRNASLFQGELDRDRLRVFDVPATAIATELGNPLSASLVLVGAYAKLTALVGVESLVEAMWESVPSYRRQHLASNERALRAGYAAVPRVEAPAWQQDAA